MSNFSDHLLRFNNISLIYFYLLQINIDSKITSMTYNNYITVDIIHIHSHTNHSLKNGTHFSIF
mgnify:CR=1